MRGPESARICAKTGVELFGDYEEKKAMLDRMVEWMEITAP